MTKVCRWIADLREGNRMKKLLLFLLIIALLLSVSSCGGENVSLGRWEENRYTNDMLSLHFSLPDDWHRADKIEAQELLGTQRTLFDGMTEDDLSAYEKDASFELGYAFVLASEEGKDRFDLLYQKNTDGSDSAAYIASARSQLESYSDLWEVRTVSNETHRICGHDYAVLEMVLQNGDTLLRYFYMTTVCRGYFITMILSTSVGDYRFESFLESLEDSSAQYYR